MANAPSPPIGTPTPFWGLGFRFELIGIRFNNMYESVVDVWLIGPYLAVPFYVISGFFYNARDYTWQADNLVKDIKRWVDGLVSGDTFRQIFERLAYHSWQLINDPRGWVYDRVRELGGDLYSLLINGKAWIESKVITSFPFMADILFNPNGWLRALLSSTFGYGVDVLTNPASWFRDWLRNVFPELANLALSPIGYILSKLSSSYPWFTSFMSNPSEKVIQWVSDRYPSMREFLINPRLEVERYVLGGLGVSYDAGLGFGGCLIRGLMIAIPRTIDIARNEMSTLACNLILRFM